MLIYFPQWQGSGLSNDLRFGAQTLREYFNDFPAIEIPLSGGELSVEHNILGYAPLVMQLKNAQGMIRENEPDPLVLIAGDCSAEVAPVQYLGDLYQDDFTLIWLDAHSDLNSPDSSPSGHFHGMPLRLILDGAFPGISVSTPIKARQLILTGVRDTDPPEIEYILDHSIEVIRNEPGWMERLLALLTKRNSKNVYIHLDLDVIDPSAFPAVKCPVMNGLLPGEVAELLRKLVDNYHVVGMTLMETTAKKQEDLIPIQPVLAVYRNYLSGWRAQ